MIDFNSAEEYLLANNSRERSDARMQLVCSYSEEKNGGTEG